MSNLWPCVLINVCGYFIGSVYDEVEIIDCQATAEFMMNWMLA